VLIAILVALSMTLLFVLVYFLFLQDSSDGGVAIESATTTAPGVTTTVPGATTTPPVTAVPAATPTTVGAAPAPQPTAAPLVIAPCVTAAIDESTTGRRGEVALYQQTLKNLGYDPGGVDGFFGPKTTDAAFAEIGDNGSLGEIFPDPPVAILFSAFQRLGIACP
jgi:peptidoglycan hydrolase-like protein with peptidoglycan-binding domain